VSAALPGESFLAALEDAVMIGGAESLERLAKALGSEPATSAVWLVLAAVGRSLPTDDEVRTAHRLAIRGHTTDLVRRAEQIGKRGARAKRRVELIRDAILVDVRHTAETDLATGIQRVARQTARRWVRDHDPLLTTWTEDGLALRRLTDDERATALDGAFPLHRSTRLADRTMVVPIGGTYILPELAAETWRVDRVAALADYSGMTTGVIGFDLVPITSAETVGDGMPTAFARNLGAVARMDRVGAISEAAATEYRGWRDMLVAAGLHGPEVDSVLLAAEVGDVTDGDIAEFEDLVGASSRKLIVVVGSHEPRKNHLAVVHAAERAWRSGHEFDLVFIGGNSWNSLDFTDQVTRLSARGRPITSLSSIADSVVWAALRRADFTVFVSLNEGFGLPVAESLASGTPVITSGFGSMAQIASTGGALTVDPRHDDSVSEAFMRLLTDEKLAAQLRREAGAYVVRTWDTYAEELWSYFVTDRRPR
jgi:glycosyltransferase involved in cell wall biosynthesis